MAADKPWVTVIVPVYNRESTIPRLVDSLVEQDPGLFECLFIDDGSTDSSLETARHCLAASGLRYRLVHWRPNVGKHRALNRVLGTIGSDFIFVVDSDDYLVGGAIARLRQLYDAWSLDSRPDVTGIEFLCQDVSTGTIVGSRFPWTGIGDHISMHYKSRVSGDKKRILRTPAVSRFRYPEIPGEKWFPPSWLWNEVGARGKCLYVNEVLYCKEYLPDSLTRQRPRLSIDNAAGLVLYHRRLMVILGAHGSSCLFQLLRSSMNESRYTWHALWRRRYRDCGVRLTALFNPAGVLFAAIDRLVLLRQRLSAYTRVLLDLCVFHASI